MSSGKSLTESFIIMVVMVTLGLVLAFGIGTTMDRMESKLTSSGMYDVSEEWQSVGLVNNLTTYVYMIFYAIPIIGVGQFIWTAVRRQKYDAYGNRYDDFD